MDFRAISNAVEFNTYQIWFLALSEDKKEIILEKMREFLDDWAKKDRSSELELTTVRYPKTRRGRVRGSRGSRRTR